MYVQIIRCTVPEHTEREIEELGRRWQAEAAGKAQGFRGMQFLREVGTPGRFIFMVTWESQDLAQASVARPETGRYFQQLLKMIHEEPEFIAAETVYTS